MDPVLHASRSLRRKNTLGLIAYLAIVVMMLLPVFGVAFNSNELLIGIPLSLLWVLFCLLLFPLLTCALYPTLFKPWAATFEQINQGNDDAKTGDT